MVAGETLSIAADAAQAGAPLALRVDRQFVETTNVARGGAVVLFSCSRIPRPHAIEVRPDAVVIHDDDGDGIVRVTPKEGIPRRSAWVAVDEATPFSARSKKPLCLCRSLRS